MSTSFVKDPDAVLDFAWSWASWVAEDETIDDATVVIVGASETTDLVIDSVGNTDTVVTAWLSAGDAGEHYSLTCHITTNQGRQDDRTIKLTIRER